MNRATALLSLLTVSGASVDQGAPGNQGPWPVAITTVVYTDGGSNGSGNVNPAAQTSGAVGQVLCQGTVPTLIDGQAHRSLLILNNAGELVWLGNSAAMSIPVSAFPLASGTSVTVDASANIQYFCVDPTQALPDAGGIENDGGGIFYMEVN